jgi:CubicO group peptidase (beta-lactamase class C family)
VRGEIPSPLGMDGTGFSYPDPAEQTAATGYQPLRRSFTPLFKAALPRRGVVGPRYGRYVTLNPFYVNGPPYGGLVGVEETARFVLLHLNSGQAGGNRLLSPESVAEMRRITPRGAKRDFGLGWYRFREAARKHLARVEHLGGGAGSWNVMRIYPEESLGVVMMGNTTLYDLESILDAIVRLHRRDRGP